MNLAKKIVVLLHNLLIIKYFKKMKKFYSLFSAVILAATVNAQAVFYSENMGTPTGTTDISSNVFQVGAPVVYTGTADVRNTLTSTTYAGASAGGNILFNALNENFIISGIDTSDYENITLSFGHNKTVNNSSNELTVEVSTDGTVWTPLTYTRPTGSGTNGWVLITASGSIPTTENLRIKFNTSTVTGGLQFRIDDVSLSGTLIVLGTDNATATKASLVKNTVVSNTIFFAAKSDVQVINANGQVVKTASVNESTSLEVSSLPAGIYIVTGNVAGKAVSQKIIKK